MEKPEVDAWHRLDARANKLEKDLASAKLQKPSKIYQAASAAPGELILYLLVKSQQRIVQDRLKNYLGKYLPMAMEVSDQDVKGVAPGTPKFVKAKADLISARLDARPKKVPPPQVIEPAPVVTAGPKR
jgi:hypothetical protein